MIQALLTCYIVPNNGTDVSTNRSVSVIRVKQSKSCKRRQLTVDKAQHPGAEFLHLATGEKNILENQGERTAHGTSPFD